MTCIARPVNKLCASDTINLYKCVHFYCAMVIKKKTNTKQSYRSVCSMDLWCTDYIQMSVEHLLEEIISYIVKRMLFKCCENIHFSTGKSCIFEQETCEQIPDAKRFCCGKGCV